MREEVGVGDPAQLSTAKPRQKKGRGERWKACDGLYRG